MTRIWKLWRFRIRTGTENAIDGSTIPRYWDILWVRSNGSYQTLFSNYLGD